MGFKEEILKNGLTAPCRINPAKQVRASVRNPEFVKARKVLMLQAAMGSTETIYGPRPVGYVPSSHSRGRSIDPMTGKLV